MDRRNISFNVYNKIVKCIPKKIIEMLPENPENLLSYATRVREINISPGIDEDTKVMMKKHVLSDEEYLKTFYYVMAISFYNKHTVNNPKLAVITAQTGSGKSNLTAKILNEDPNYVFIDSDKYKHYRYDAIEISNTYPLLYPYLTGPDAYDHAYNIYSYALDHKYNIIKETAPSANKNLIEADFKNLEDKNYTISIHALAVSNLNSLLSMHERYELQIINGLKTAKLTGLSRHDESYNALVPNIVSLTGHPAVSSICVYKRGTLDKSFKPELIFPSSNYNTPAEAIENERLNDLQKTREEFEKRYMLLIKQMKERTAPSAQFEQLEKIRDLYKEGD